MMRPTFSKVRDGVLIFVVVVLSIMFMWLLCSQATTVVTTPYPVMSDDPLSR